MKRNYSVEVEKSMEEHTGNLLKMNIYIFIL